MLLRSLLASALALAGPAEPSAPESADAQVAEVAHRLGIGALPYCPGEAVQLPGFVVHKLDEYHPEARAELADEFGADNLPVVLSVVADSSAAAAGMLAGDMIVRIEGVAIPPSDASTKPALRRTKEIEALVEGALGDGRAKIEVRRGGATHVLVLFGERGCPTRVRIVKGGDLNASSGRYIQITTKLFNFMDTKDELALVIAHELAHNLLKHKERLDAQGVSRGLFRAFGKNPGRIRATENEADRLALHLMHAAGYDIGVAPAFWDRFGRETDHGIFSDGTHASRKQRVAIAEQEIAAIRAGGRTDGR